VPPPRWFGDGRALDGTAVTQFTGTPAAARCGCRPVHQAMCVRNVTGGKETNPMWLSKVGKLKTAKL